MSITANEKQTGFDLREELEGPTQAYAMILVSGSWLKVYYDYYVKRFYTERTFEIATVKDDTRPVGDQTRPMTWDEAETIASAIDEENVDDQEDVVVREPPDDSHPPYFSTRTIPNYHHAKVDVREGATGPTISYTVTSWVAAAVINS